MHLSTALALASTASIAAAHPFHFSRRAVPAIPNTSTFDILLAGNLNGDTGTLDESVQVMILDLEENEAATIENLKTSGKTVICYFSAGTYEPNRDASAQFQDSDLGNTMKDWPDEKWVNVESENVRKIMSGRIQAAADKGCMGVDADNLDGYQPDNDDGFGKTAAVHAEYVKFLAGEAASRNLAMGLKNALDLIPDVVDVVQFAVNEECHAYNECDKYKPFTEAGKAVFNIEYGGQCGAVEGVTMSTVLKSLDLNELGGQCGGSGTTPTETKTGATPSATEADVSEPEETEPAATQPAATKPATTGVAQPTKSATPSSTTVPEPTSTAPAEEEEDEDEDEDEELDDEDSLDEDEEEQTERPHYGYHGGGRNRTRGYKEE